MVSAALDRHLERLGLWTAENARGLLLLAALLVVASVPVAFRDGPLLQSDFERGWTTDNAPSVEEIRSQTDFFGGTDVPWYAALIAEPKEPDGSMIGSDEFAEMKAFYTYLTKNITIAGDSTYADYCGDNCDVNDSLFLTVDMVNMLSWFADVPLKWPVTVLDGKFSNIGKWLYERKIDPTDGRMTSSRLACLYFMTFSNSTQSSRDLEHYEYLIASAINRHNAALDTKVNFTWHGMSGMRREIGAAVEASTKVLALGLALGAVAFVFVFWWSARMAGNTTGFVYAALAALISAVLAFFTSLAALLLLRCHVTPPLLFSLFALFAQTLDGCTVLYSAWTAVGARSETTTTTTTAKRQLAMTLSHSGGRWLLPFLASFVGSLVGASFITVPEWRSLAIFLAFSSLFQFLYQAWFFLPTLTLLCRSPSCHQPPKVVVTSNGKTAQLLVEQPLMPQNGTSKDGDLNLHSPQQQQQQCKPCKVVASIASVGGKMSAGVVIVLLVLLAGFGLQNLTVNLDYRSLILPDSPAVKGVKTISDIVWPDFLHLMYVIERPPRFDDPDQYQDFLSFVAELEAMNGTIGRRANMMWLNDYRRFIQVDEGKEFGALNMSQFDEFINDHIFKAWQKGVHYEKGANGAIIVKDMLMMIAYSGAKSMADKIELIGKCRQIVRRYPQFAAHVFDPEARMIDVVAQAPGQLALFGLGLALALPAVTAIWTGLMIRASIVVTVLASLLGLATVASSSLLCVQLHPFTVALLFELLLTSLRSAAFFVPSFPSSSSEQTSKKTSPTSQDVILSSLRDSFRPLVSFFLVSLAIWLPGAVFSPAQTFSWMGQLGLAQAVLQLLLGLLVWPAVLSFVSWSLTSMC